jgi:hypothetical protein
MISKQEREAMREKERQETDAFRARLEEENDIVGHPKADKLWSLAWEYGHAYGYTEVKSYYVEMMELLK